MFYCVWLQNNLDKLSYIYGQCIYLWIVCSYNFHIIVWCLQTVLFFKNLFIILYLFLASLGLRCCVGAFSSCGGGATLRCSVQSSHCSGFSCCGARALGTRASVVVAYRLSSCASWAPEHRLSSCGTRA